MKAQNIQYWINRFVLAGCVLLIAYGTVTIAHLRALMDQRQAALLESMTLPFELDSIRAIRERDPGLAGNDIEPGMTQQIWDSQVKKVIASRAFADVIVANTNAKAVYPSLGFNQALFVKSLSELPVESKTESGIRRVMGLISLQAASNAATTSFAMTNQILLSAGSLIAGLLGLLFLQGLRTMIVRAPLPAG